jgi:hypothetical protein
LRLKKERVALLEKDKVHVQAWRRVRAPKMRVHKNAEADPASDSDADRPSSVLQHQPKQWYSTFPFQFFIIIGLFALVHEMNMTNEFEQGAGT